MYVSNMAPRGKSTISLNAQQKKQWSATLLGGLKELETLKGELLVDIAL